MKFLLPLFLLITSSASYSLEILEHAYEAEKIRAEYYDTSDSGIIRPINCNACTKDIYNIHSETRFYENGEEITPEYFIRVHQSKSFITLFIDVKSELLTRVRF